MISTLKETFPKYPIAYSDHTPDADMDIAAVSLGENLVEKTISLNKETRSVEHIFSLEPIEMKKFILRIRDLEVALGKNKREISQKQKENRKVIRRSPYLKKSAKRGTIMKDLEIEFRRPGLGMSPKQWEELSSKNFILNEDLEKNNYLSKDNFFSY